MDNPMFLPALLIVVGGFIMGLGGMVFRFRAVANKRAWNGATLPLLGTGLVILLIGLGALWLAYPH